MLDLISFLPKDYRDIVQTNYKKDLYHFKRFLLSITSCKNIIYDAMEMLLISKYQILRHEDIIFCMFFLQMFVYIFQHVTTSWNNFQLLRNCKIKTSLKKSRMTRRKADFEIKPFKPQKNIKQELEEQVEHLVVNRTSLTNKSGPLCHQKVH